MESIFNFTVECLSLEDFKVKETLEFIWEYSIYTKILIVLLTLLFLNNIFLLICSKVNDAKKEMDEKPIEDKNKSK